MPVIFTSDQRKQITRRQLNILVENAAYASTQTNLNAEKAKLLSVDDANSAFYLFHKNRAISYENEARRINGTQPATYTDGVISPYSAGDLSTSAAFPGSAGALFSPSSPIYTFFIPKVVDAVNGYAHPVGTDSRYELNILSNAIVLQGLTEMIFRLSNGITGATPASTTTTTTIPSGTVTGLVLSTVSTTNFTNGELVYINNGSSSGIYKITAIVPATSITVDSVIPSSLGIASGGTISNTVAAFTGTERQNLTSVVYQEILSTIASTIFSLVAEWEGKINDQISDLLGNNEERATQVAQNATALADVNNTKTIIDTWQALPNTGVGAKYTSSGIAPISAEITARQSFTSTRITQIVTALGNVAQTGDLYSGVVGSPYFERYKWLNVRINKATGSARRFYAADQGSSFVGMLLSDNNALLSEYNAYFLTKAITFLDEKTIIQVKDVSGLLVGDTVTVLSETQPEIQRAVIEIMGTTQLRFDKSIPNSYLLDDQARLFKTL